MNSPVHCDDVRELVAASRGGHSGLTELVFVEAHVGECPSCRRHLEQLESGRWRRLVPPAMSFRIAVGAGALLLVALAAHRVLPFFGFGNRIDPSEHPLPSAAASADVEPTPSLAVTPPSVPTDEPVTIVTQASPPPATLPGPDPARTVPAAEPARDRPTPPGSRAHAAPSQPVPESTDVLGRLTVKDLGEARRRLAGLLSGVDATVDDWQQRGVTLTQVELVVPRLKYPNLTQALAQTGTWRIEAQRSPLPDMVRVTVQVTE